MDVDPTVLMYTFRVACFELAFAALNYFVLMRRAYEPRLGVLRAHQLGMTTRIVGILVFAWFIPAVADTDQPWDLLVAGVFWLLMILAFEWVGSFLLRRPVREILEGWHVERGFMWPYVLLTYGLAPLVVGTLLHPAG